MFAAQPSRVADLARHLNQVSSALYASATRRALPVLDRASARVSLDIPLVEAALAKLDPTLSLRAIRSRVVRIVDETPDTKTYWLRPNARFGSFRPGSYVTLRLRIGGQTVERNYSLSAAPRTDGLIAITVKRIADGRVSNWLADQLRIGQVVELSAAQGKFVLPAALPAKLVMLSAGSGITPVMSILRQLVAAGSRSEVAFLHFARTPRDIIFRDELERIARTHPNIRVEFCVEETPGHDAVEWTQARGRFCESLLERVAPDFRSLDTYLCGPSGFMKAVMQTFEKSGADMSKLRYERFSVEFDASAFLEHAHVLRFLRSETESISNQPRTILEEAERAGLQVPFGCRAGNCGTCRCRKASGVVVDVTTGVASEAGEGFIYPCVSVPRGNVEVDL